MSKTMITIKGCERKPILSMIIEMDDSLKMSACLVGASIDDAYEAKNTELGDRWVQCLLAHMCKRQNIPITFPNLRTPVYDEDHIINIIGAERGAKPMIELFDINERATENAGITIRDKVFSGQWYDAINFVHDLTDDAI